MPTTRPERLLPAIGCIVASAFGFALMGMFVRLADFHGEEISAFQKGFFRNLVALIIALALFMRHGEPMRRLTASSWMSLVLRAVFGTLGIFANFYAISRINLCDALMLNKMAPFFTVVFTWLFVGERVTLRQGLCVVGALLGTALVVRPGFAHVALLPASIGLSSGLCAGAAYACVRKLGREQVDGRFIVLFFSAFSCLASVPFMIHHFTPMTSAQTAILVGAGAAAALGQFGITTAYRLAEPRQIAVFDYTNVIFGALLGCWVLGQPTPDALTVLGFVIIVTMGRLCSRRREGEA